MADLRGITCRGFIEAATSAAVLSELVRISAALLAAASLKQTGCGILCGRPWIDLRGITCRGLIDAAPAGEWRSRPHSSLRGITCRGLIEALVHDRPLSHCLDLRGITCRGLIEALQPARAGKVAV